MKLIRSLYSVVVVLLVLVFLPTDAFATRDKLQGWCAQGGVAVSIPGTQGSGSQRFEQTFPNATVNVFVAGTATLATLYADPTGTAQANPFTANSQGYWTFYTDTILVDVRCSSGGISAPFTFGALRTPNEWFNVMDFGAKCDGTTNDYTAINNANTAATTLTGGGTVYFPDSSTRCRIATNLTFSSDVTAAFSGGGGITVDSGVTVAFNGGIQAPLTPIFAGVGTVTISPSDRSGNREIYPQWWGAKGDNSTDDTTALTAWLAALGVGNIEVALTGYGEGFLPAGIYKYTSNLTVPHSAHINGEGPRSILRPSNAVTQALIQSIGSTVENITINGIDTTDKIGLSIGESSLVSNGVTRNVRVFNFTGTSAIGVNFYQAVQWEFDNVISWDNHTGWRIGRDSASPTLPTATVFTNITAKSNDGVGILLKSGSVLTFIGGVAEINGDEGVLGFNTGSILEMVTFSDGFYLEANQQNQGSPNNFYDLRIDGTGTTRTNNITVRNVFFCCYGAGATVPKAIHFDDVLDFVIEGSQIDNDAANVLTSGTSRGIVTNWPVRNGSIFTTISDTSSGGTKATFVASSSLMDFPIGVGTAVTTGASGSDVVIPNSRGVRGVNAAGNDTFQMIGVNSSNDISIDPSGVGIVTGGYVQFGGIAFGSLGTPPNGTVIYCSDCTNASNPCSGGSTGAIAKRLAGAWDCR